MGAVCNFPLITRMSNGFLFTASQDIAYSTHAHVLTHISVSSLKVKRPAIIIRSASGKSGIVELRSSHRVLDGSRSCHKALSCLLGDVDRPVQGPRSYRHPLAMAIPWLTRKEDAGEHRRQADVQRQAEVAQKTQIQEWRKPETSLCMMYKTTVFRLLGAL